MLFFDLTASTCLRYFISSYIIFFYLSILKTYIGLNIIRYFWFLNRTHFFINFFYAFLLSTNIFEKSKFNYPVHIRKIRFLIAYWHVSIFSWAMPRSIKQSYSDLKLQPNNKKHESYKHVTYNLVETYLKAHLIYFLYHIIWIRIFK